VGQLKDWVDQVHFGFKLRATNSYTQLAIRQSLPSVFILHHIIMIMMFSGE